jgi:hypothetical protein
MDVSVDVGLDGFISEATVAAATTMNTRERPERC